MTTTNLTEYQQHLITWAKKDAKSKRNTWPGFPLTNLPFVAKPDLDVVIAAGLLRIVEVERPNPIGGGTRVLSYVVPA